MEHIDFIIILNIFTNYSNYFQNIINIFNLLYYNIWKKYLK